MELEINESFNVRENPKVSIFVRSRPYWKDKVERKIRREEWKKFRFAFSVLEQPLNSFHTKDNDKKPKMTFGDNPVFIFIEAKFRETFETFFSEGVKATLDARGYEVKDVKRFAFLKSEQMAIDFIKQLTEGPV